MRGNIQVTKTATLTGHRDCIYALENAADQRHIISGDGEGMVVKWDLDNPEEGELPAKSPASVYSLAYLPNTNKLLIGQNYSGIHVLDLSSKKEEKFIQLNSAAIYDIKEANNQVWAACGNGSVYVFDSTDFKLIKHLQYSEQSARVLATNPQANEIAVGYSDHTIRVFSTTDYSLLHTLSGHTNSVFSLCYHPKTGILVSGSRDASLKIWDSKNGYQLSKSIAAHLFSINNLAFSPDASRMVSVSMDKSVKIWDAHSFELLKVIDKSRHAGHGTSVNKVLWKKYQEKIVTCSDDRTISVWDVKF